jgi:hypothetical protein
VLQYVIRYVYCKCSITYKLSPRFNFLYFKFEFTTHNNNTIMSLKIRTCVIAALKNPLLLPPKRSNTIIELEDILRNLQHGDSGLSVERRIVRLVDRNPDSKFSKNMYAILRGDRTTFNARSIDAVRNELARTSTWYYVSKYGTERDRVIYYITGYGTFFAFGVMLNVISKM